MHQDVHFPAISSHSSADESPGYLLWRVSTLWRRSIEAVLKPLGLTHPQFVILAATGWLTRQGRRASQGQIGQQAALDPNTTSQILRTLEQKGLIQRPRLASDERGKYPILTPSGIKALTTALPLVERADATYFASVDLHHTTLLKALQRLAKLDHQ
jgi:DNA-binding MarR family transcriptional regulator